MQAGLKVKARARWRARRHTLADTRIEIVIGDSFATDIPCELLRDPLTKPQSCRPHQNHYLTL